MPAKSGAKKKRLVPSTEVAPLKSQNVVVCGHRTSMRLEPSMWEAFEEIARREELSINDLCSLIKRRLDEQARRKGLDPEDSDVTLTSAVRVFIATYFRRASTEDGHQQARHGRGDPFLGTPFEDPPEAGSAPVGEGGGSAGGSGSDEGPASPPGRRLNSMPYSGLHADM